MARIPYRREIDGLRALAVALVVLFHAGAILPGGYVGVDVFFVISGYLMARLALGPDRLPAGAFFARRARRLVPALAVVAVASLALAPLLLPPAELAAFGDSLAATALFVGNFTALRQTGYFAPAADLAPLLHTWSLAVEEQFYLAVPPLAALLALAGRRRAILAGLCLAGFLLAAAALPLHPGAAFYLLPARAWEFLAGALVAEAVPPLAPRTRATAAALGLALILAAALLFDAATPFPGPAALLPVAGAALVLACAGPDNATGRLLALRPLVALGLVSYGVYLWHQPVLAFAAARLEAPHAPGTLALLVALVVALAAATFVLVERPARRARLRPAQTFALAAAVVAGLAAVGVATARGIFPADPRLVALAASAAPAPNRAACHGGPAQRLAAACVSGPVATLAVFGDSHGVELAAALAAALPGEGVAAHTFSACGPAGGAPACATWRETTLARLAATPSIGPVVVTFRLAWYLGGDHRAAWPGVPEPRPEAAAMRAGLAAIAARLAAAGKHVVFVRQAPELPLPVAFLALRAGPDGPLAGAPRAWWEARRAASLAAEPPGVATIDPAAVLCDAVRCHAGVGATAYYFDDNHLSMAGARLVAERVAQALRADERTLVSAAPPS